MKKQEKTILPNETQTTSDTAPAQNNPRSVGLLLLLPGILLSALAIWMYVSTTGTHLLTIPSSTGQFYRQYPLFAGIGVVCLLVSAVLLKKYPKLPQNVPVTEDTAVQIAAGSVRTAPAAAPADRAADNTAADVPAAEADLEAETAPTAEQPSGQPAETQPEKRFCTACGAPLAPDDKFCLQCGTKVN